MVIKGTQPSLAWLCSYLTGKFNVLSLSSLKFIHFSLVWWLEPTRTTVSFHTAPTALFTELLHLRKCLWESIQLLYFGIFTYLLQWRNENWQTSYRNHACQIENENMKEENNTYCSITYGSQDVLCSQST